MKVSPSTFKKAFSDFKKNFNARNYINNIIIEYFSPEAQITRVGTVLVELESLISIPEYIGTYNIDINAVRHREFSSLTRITTIQKLPRNYVIRKNYLDDNTLELFLRYYYDDFTFIIHPYRSHNSRPGEESLLTKYLKNLYYRQDDSTYRDLFTDEVELYIHMVYDMIEELIPYIYSKITSIMMDSFTIKGERPYRITFYKCYNENTEIYNTMCDNECTISELIYQPYITFGTQHDLIDLDSKYYGNSNKNGVAPDSNMIKYVLFPNMRRIYQRSVTDVKDCITYTMPNFICTDHDMVSSDKIVCLLYYYKHESSYLRKNYTVGNLLSNLYINVQYGADDSKDKKVYLLEYNNTGTTIKNIETVLNVADVIKYNRVNQSTILPQNVRTIMMDMRHEYKSQQLSANTEINNKIGRMQLLVNRHYLNEIYPKLTDDQSFLENEKLAKESIYKYLDECTKFNPKSITMESMTIRIDAYKHNPISNFTIDKRLLVVPALTFFKGANVLDDILLSTLQKSTHARINLCTFMLHPDYNFNVNEVINNSIVFTTSINTIINGNSNGRISYAYYKDDNRYKIQNYCNTLIDSIYNDLIPFIYQMYRNEVDSIFDSNSDSYKKYKEAYINRYKMYKKYIKAPTLEQNNQDSTKSNTIDLSCPTFMTQLSYYSSTFKMHTNLIYDGK